MLLCLGEALVDLVATAAGSLADAPGFVAAPGGAPANVAVGAARLGVPVAFMGKVGDDPFGHKLRATLAEQGVDVAPFLLTREAKTGLAFVSLREDGERDFLFYRDPSADMLLRPDEVAFHWPAGVKALHVGSITLIAEPSRSATLAAVERARASGALVSYDVNLRLPLWPSVAAARDGLRTLLPLADVVKVSEEEMAFVLEAELPLAEAGARLRAEYGIPLLCVTLGAAGAAFFTADGDHGVVPGFRVAAIDTTGAGDGFVAGLLVGLLERWPVHPASLPAEALHVLLRRANAVGALTTTQRGAIPALPDRPAVEALLAASAI